MHLRILDAILDCTEHKRYKGKLDYVIYMSVVGNIKDPIYN